MTITHRIYQYLCLCLMFCIPMCATAEEVMPFPVIELVPENHWVIRLDPRYATIDHEYDSSGTKQATAFTMHATYIRFIAAYGLTADITLGAIMPYGQICSQPQGVLSDPATQAYLIGLGYIQPQKHCDNQPGDFIMGGFWRFSKTTSSDWVLGMAASLGTSKEDDPDDLIDLHFGESNHDIILQLENFHRWGDNSLDTRVLLKGTIQLDDHLQARIPTTAGVEIAPLANSTRVGRDLGDIFELELELGKTLGDWRIAGGWAAYRKGLDAYSGEINGYNASNLEPNSDETRRAVSMSLSWHSIRLFKQQAFPLPMVADIEWQRVYEGKNAYENRRLYMIVKFIF